MTEAKLEPEILEEVIKIREDIHMHPELGFEEVRTSKLIAEKLKELGFEVQENVAKTGVVGLLKGGAGEGKTILVRADIDALPLQEMNDVSYKSIYDGKMHACGHDAHIAIALGVAMKLARIKDQLKGNIKFVFQPAEEGPGGAKPMVEAGVLENPKVDAAVALHVAGLIPEGMIATKPKEFTAAADEFHVILKGPGGHGSAPHNTKDLVAIGSLVVQALNMITAREVDPLEPVVITVGKFSGGTRHNIIGDKAEIHGTIRSFNPEVRDYVNKRVKEIVKGISELFGADVEIEMIRGYPPGYNDPKLTELVVRAAKKAIGEENVVTDIKPIMGAEDFFEFSNGGKIPAVMFWVGVYNKEKGYIYENHSSKFDLGPKALETGVLVMSEVVKEYLSS